MTTRIYLVTDSETGKNRLVEATSQSAARSHVATPRFIVQVATAKIVASAYRDNPDVEVEVAGNQQDV